MPLYSSAQSSGRPTGSCLTTRLSNQVVCRLHWLRKGRYEDQITIKCCHGATTADCLCLNCMKKSSSDARDPVALNHVLKTSL
uniref:Uncharacterized protein n=1 Tax=Hyaloperonospora arabidopsidis (strain Emoy2) TaxID=559515 RepID=M4BZ53_HYAAE